MGKQGAAIAAMASFLLLLSFGCVQISVQQFFYPNGRSQVVQQVEVEPLVAALNSSGLVYQNRSGFEGWEAVINSSCARAPSYERGSRCRRIEGWLVIEQSRVQSADYVFTSYDQFPYTIYELTVLRPPKIPLDILDDSSLVKFRQGDLFANSSDLEVGALSQSGIRYAYFIQMPGDIFNISEGRLVDRGMEFDVLVQALAHRPLYVKSRVLNLQQVALAIIILLDAFLFFDVAFLYAIGWVRKHKQQLDKLRREADARAAEARAAQKKSKLRGYEVYEYDQGEPISKLSDMEKEEASKNNAGKGKEGEGKGKKNPSKK